jgi:hypothetical protein
MHLCSRPGFFAPLPTSDHKKKEGVVDIEKEMIKIIKKALPGKVRARLTTSSFSPFEEGFWRSPPAINPR